ncbi:MAG: septal ring lytic transglycosylase RlpA family protein [Gemmatimonadota bacterium]
MDVPRRVPGSIVSLALAASVSACTMVGYPSSSPPPPYGPDVRDVGDTDLPREPASELGNPRTYEVFGRTYRTLASAEGLEEEGLASWYGDEFEGRSTSSGEVFDPDRLTAAHRSIPLPSWVEVENLDNGRRVIVRVNDRGPFVDPENRIIDLSEAAARRIGMVGTGVAPVRIRVLVSARVPESERR